MSKPTNYYDIPKSVQKLLRYNAMTPDEHYMPEKYAKMSVESLLKQVSKLRKKRAKQLKVLDEFIKIVNE